MDTSSLQNFVKLVPTCVHTASLKTALAVWTSSAQDSGSVPLHRVEASAAHLLVIVDQQEQPLGWLNLAHLLPLLLTDAGAALWSRPLEVLQTSVLTEPQTLLQPLVSLPLSLSLPDLWTYLQTLTTSLRQPIGLVDEAGRFQGLLDSDRLLQMLARQALPVPETAVAAAWLPSAVDLLAQLPWPLRLQTASGQVVSENLVWQTQISQLINPDEITEQVAAQLQVQPRQTAQRSSQPLSSQASTCIVQVENGQESTWQFFKIPLQVTPAAGTDVEFQLASLTTSPIADPRTIAVGIESLCLILIADLTDQEQTAQELTAKNADLTELNRMKDEFLACISHELKTPLTAILGLTGVLKEKGVGDLSPRQDRYARLIYQSSRQLMMVINDILDVTRLETHQLELLPEPVEIRSVCERALEQVVRLYAEDMAETTKLDLAHNIQLEIEPGLETLVADTLRLRQMLVHLLTNALKFTDADGSVGLTARRWQGWLSFTVWDTGIGIPVDKQHLIFQKFQQLENSLSRRYPGIGLGLILVQRLARLHGGEVTFTSQEGEGSQFTLLLPPCPPQPTSAFSPLGLEPFATPNSPAAPVLTASQLPRSLDTQPALTSGMILIVETSPQAIADWTRLLSRPEYRIVVARSGTEAIEKARRLRPALMFLNPLLPLLSGWDVLTLLKANQATASVPIVITAPVSEKHQALQQGADGFLSLPVQETELQNSLERFCRPEGASQRSASTAVAPTVAQSPAPRPQQFANLTVLRLDGGLAQEFLHGEALNPYEMRGLASAVQTANDFCDRHLHDCHLLEAADLDQAEIVARLWRPDVVLIAWDPPLSFFEQLSQRAALAALPLITFSADATCAASQIPGLAVFPISGTSLTLPPMLDSSTLLEVLQMAAGVNLKPTLLTLDAISAYETLPRGGQDSLKRLQDIPQFQPTTDMNRQVGQWLQALNQYLQAAGFNVVQGYSAGHLQTLLANQAIDLLLISLRGQRPSPALVQELQDLRVSHSQIPIWLLNGPEQTLESERSSWTQTLGIQVIPANTAIPELVRQLHPVLLCPR